MEHAFDLNQLVYNEQGLIPAIAQDVKTKEVLMLAYMSKASLEATLSSGLATYYSRSRQSLWQKGETSGNIQRIKAMTVDCDFDTLLLDVEQVGNACHTHRKSCFFTPMIEGDYVSGSVIRRLYQTIEDRKNNPKEGSYTTYLFQKGIDKILKKVGEEASEVIIGAKNASANELVSEISDLVYHLSVLMVNEGITWDMVEDELIRRQKK